MQFQVPQFLDVEDKIIGPLTLKQFLYIAGGVGLGYLSYRFIPWIGVVLGLGFIGVGVALGFYKYNNKPLVFLIQSAIDYFRNDRFYVWERKEKIEETKLDLNNFKPTKHAPRLSMKTLSSKLSDLAWSMDVPPEEAEAERRSDELGI
ncbi:MAG: hypothetical protein A2942_00775 [Candidatus Lloydbacteria bacterium RIFCSPLOWO2_01_FULL_50_20]|uniref:PrgI family protein n=1 Tax=Candidatus Lloydbacteria bacterium RIFCSPLOWO2_01_FULL_50_20 TaxID=1798665 RepID=A0A1G2DD70_9BACT|nr:MAG: hypothetical protein A3C13_00900 [Candidatus Lloydbacteria bacterium RIFCSPHIGHO2_02_FULL_50_11]OGZ11536.1 MAG: hypothetical protein A2942_00775 [Candidatus Lloydbacteria bacterium RIFCSPLOWO2_01_FULL_50_20]